MPPLNPKSGSDIPFGSAEISKLWANMLPSNDSATYARRRGTLAHRPNWRYDDE
jgi:hypothetical protein